MKNRPLKTRNVSLDFCQGSNEGKAIYLTCTEEDGSGWGHRVAGPKCWGDINPIRSFSLDKDDLEELIHEAKNALKWLKKNK